MYLIFPIIFNILFFSLCKNKDNVSIIISYIWIHLAYLTVVISPLLVNKTISKEIFKYTQQLISIIYFGIEFVIGLIFILIKPENYKITLIFQAVVFLIYLFVFIFIYISNEHTANNEKISESEVEFIKNSANKVKTLMSITSDNNVKKSLEYIYDLIHSSPSKSNNMAKDYENKINSLIDELCILVRTNNNYNVNSIIDEIKFLVIERNRITMNK